MEPIFLRFESYNFEADQRFVDGIKSLKRPNTSGSETGLLDLKLFYYNKFIEPIDLNSYKQRTSALLHTPHRDSSEEPEQRTDDICGDAQSEQLSFAEVMRLIQDGKEVPRVTKLDIQASNQSPTPSQMERRRKPWETASV